MNENQQKSLVIAALGLGAASIILGVLARQQVRRTRSKPKTVLITGGARGLGLELARIWCSQGSRVAICSRNPAQIRKALAELRATGGEAIGFKCDITDQKQVVDMIKSIEEQCGPIDILVNNAGIIQVGPQEAITTDDYEKSLATHFWGPFFAIEAVLPSMRERGIGNIVNIASIGGKISVPHMIPYSVGKFALAAFSEGLQNELSRNGITVTSVYPGIMRTGSPRNAMFKGQNRKEYTWFSLSSSVPFLSIDSRRAARQIVRAVSLGRSHIYVSLFCKVATRLHHLLPNISNSILRIMTRLLPKNGGIGRRQTRGFNSESSISPSLITVLNERAATRNNER
jgi:NAD(P)-dependent dehydrogenase (short-subunit alcohol dehydrogenase family)